MNALLGWILLVLSVRDTQAWIKTGENRHWTKRLTRWATNGDGNYEITAENGKRVLRVNVGRDLYEFETGVVARQADGAITLKCGDSLLLATACTENVREFMNKVDYMERFSAVGQTSGGYNKRDGRASDYEILVARLIDRPIRPVITEGWTHETQLLTYLLSYDLKHSPESLAISASSAALAISSIPIKNVVAGVQIGSVNGSFVVNPTRREMEDSPLNLIVAGTRDSILMIEGECSFLTEDQMLQALEIGQKSISLVCRAIEAWKADVGKPKRTESLIQIPSSLYTMIHDKYAQLAEETLRRKGAVDGVDHVGNFYRQVQDECMPCPFLEEEDDSIQLLALKIACKKLLQRSMQNIVASGRRVDGRKLDEVRPITIKMSPLPKVHGSALFTRGDTQSLATVTLGGTGMQQRTETVRGEEKKRFYLQYNFPPFCVGEVSRVGAPGRREIGHGNLAERALSPIIPSEEEFPYTLRVESLITESCGSSSMASVCGGTLAMMDAGIPVKATVAGVAMGLILDESNEEASFILTDIMEIEDAYGTMDFKIAGDQEGITTFQLDIKCGGLSLQLLRRALLQAKEGRKHVIDTMTAACPGPRDALSPLVAKFTLLRVDPSNIGKIIGSAGKQIRAIIEEFDLIDIEVEDDGTVLISSNDLELNQKAKDFIESLLGLNEKKEEPRPRVAEGGIYRNCEIKGIHPFGCFVEVLPGVEGLVHISELDVQYVRNIDRFIKKGDKIDVKVLNYNDKGQLRLSRRALMVEEADVKTEATETKQ